MAHLPENVDDLDDALVSGDPVVRLPKTMVVLPEPASYARKTVLAVSLIALIIGGTLGAVGIGIVYATHIRTAFAASHRSARAARAIAADAGTLTFSLSSGSADAGVALANGAANLPTLPAPPGTHYNVAHQRLGRNHTLPMVLRSLGLANDVAVRVIRSLRTLLNMRSLQPSDVVLVERDPASNNELRRVEYRRSETQVWAVDVAPDLSCTAQRVDVTRTTERIVTGFTVGESMDETLRAANLQSDILPRLQEVFTALDLGHELHRGDTVRLIVQQDLLNGVFWRYGTVEAVDYRGINGQRRGFFLHIGRGGDFFDAQGFTRERGPLHPPVVPFRVTSPFNPRRMHPILHRIMPHQGTDIGAPVGTPVYAAADGEILSLGGDGPTGNLVRLSHPALGIETGYAHLSRFAPGLHTGLHVHAHQLVGYVGSTGRSTGPHLHFACKRHGEFFDCQTMCAARRSVPANLRAEFDGDVQRLSAELDAIHVDGQIAAPPPAPTDEPDAEATPATDETDTEDQSATE